MSFNTWGHRRNKTRYGNEPVPMPSGHSYRSKLEASVHQILLVMEKAGELNQIEREVSIRLPPHNRRWVVDFRVWDLKLGCVVWHEAKGAEQDRWKHLLDLWPIFGPAPLSVWHGDWKRPLITETIERMDDVTLAQARERAR